METVDVLVIGGGAAGAAAALAAAAGGARTMLVRPGPGATALCAGGWPDLPPAGFAAALAAAGLPLRAGTAALPHPDGRLLSCAAAPVSHARACVPATGETAGARASGESGESGGTGETEEAGSLPALVCGIAGLPSFRPHALAALWADAARLPTDALQPVLLTLAGTPAAGWSAATLGTLLQRDVGSLAGAVARAARERGAVRAILPAVLGLDEHGRVHAALESGAGLPAGEALAVAPSLPGWRLDHALLQALAEAGVRVFGGRVVGGSAAGSTVEHVAVAAAAAVRATGAAAPPTAAQPFAAQPFAVRAGAYVLATGKFIGGGVAAGTRYEETVLGLPVAVLHGGRRFTDAAESLAVTEAARTAAQPVLNAGVTADAGGRPLDEAGDVAYHNVLVAGSIRAGAGTASLGLGAAAHDGWRAGTAAAALAGLAGRA
jgi:glycerol-3-phosphate dehydrogenase subunit B